MSRWLITSYDAAQSGGRFTGPISDFGGRFRQVAQPARCPVRWASSCEARTSCLLRLRMSVETESSPAHTSPRWQPLEAIERRILGVLVEKAKTTPENYPLSLNALKSGCNQKNNRSPLMQLEEPQIEEALEKLRKVGAVVASAGDQPRRSVSPSGLRLARRRKGRAGRDGRAAVARRPNRRRAARPGRPDGADQGPGRFAADARFAREKTA